ncbi:MAG: phosphoglycerate dehydrogenase [Actinomycetaceae bacterium]|nr:phosphoglycerate dehydrogenase [Actinomycetaceae bacterium]
MTTRALLLEDPHTSADPILENAGIEVERLSGALDESQLINALTGVKILGIRSKTMITKAVLEASPDLACIGCFCIGTNQVDLAQAAKQGITVFNAPYSNTRSVVEMAICEVISLLRRLSLRNAELQRGIWNKSSSGSHEVRGRTLGIIGYGSIGSQLSVLAEAMGMKVVFYDIIQKLALGNATKMSSMEEVLRIADVVSLHVDGREANDNMFGPVQFAQMKKGASLINLARGSILDINALREAITSGHISGAAIDVFPVEPLKNGDPFTSELTGLENVILTPHIGGSTMEAQKDIGEFVADKMASYELLASTDMAVNVPSLSLPLSEHGRHRIAFFHHNTPGVLAKVNQIFAETGVNIEGQILGTKGELGYVITDVSSELPVEALAQVRSLEDTLRLRVISTQE